MPHFDSPLGTKKISGAPMKEFSVPDDSDYGSIDDLQSSLPSDYSSDAYQVEQEIKAARAAREAKKNGKERLNDGARRRIEMLIGMTTLTRTVVLDNNSYSFKTLADKEIRETYIAAAEFDGTVQFPYEIRKQLLGRSLTQIAGVDVDQFLGNNSLSARFAFIGELPDSLVSRLFTEYQILAKESNDKYSIKTEEDAKEFAEDLKK